MSADSNEFRFGNAAKVAGVGIAGILAVVIMLGLIPVGWLLTYSGFMSTDSCGPVECDSDALDNALILTTFGPGAILVLSGIVCLLVPRSRPDRTMLRLGALYLGVFFSLVTLVVGMQFLDAVHQS